MQNKLQELTDKLYQEGLSKGQAEADRIVEKAKAEAEAAIAAAKAEAEAIKAEAEKEAEALKSKVASDLKMASEQCLQATKKDIENLLTSKLAGDAVSSSLSEAGFVKEIIKTVADKFSSSESADMALVLPENLKAELEPWVSSELCAAVKGNVSASFSKKVNGGFTISPKDGSWFISFTDETFKELIGEYIRPVTRKLLFG